MSRILVINPGSTSTKVALYSDSEQVSAETIRHSAQELAAFGDIASQLPFRKQLILQFLGVLEFTPNDLDVVIGRGGLVKPLSSGVYKVDEKLMEDLAFGKYGMHASNLGGLLAHSIASEGGIQAYIADPVVVDEMQEISKITGLPRIRRRSVFHALNHKSVARKYALSLDKPYESLNLIVAHLGGGISVGAHKKGRVVDVNNAFDGDGPFSPERAGTLPAGQFAELCMCTGYSIHEINSMLAGRAGVTALLGTNDISEVMKQVQAGDGKAALVIDAMCLAVSKSIGAMAAVLDGQVDQIILTGGIAHNGQICGAIIERVGFISGVTVIPGENEMEALASNALAVLNGDTLPLDY